MLRRILNRYTLAFFILVSLGLFLTNLTGLDREKTTIPEKFIRRLIEPLETGFARITVFLEDTVKPVFSISSIKQENEILKRRVAELERENLLLREFQYQNLRLRELLQFKDSIGTDYETISASVIGRNPSNWFKTVTINRGKSDGIAKNMPVVTSSGLVGHVINVSESSAEVLLIIDNSSAVGGLVQVTRTPGVVEGMADNSGNLKMIHLSKEAPIREKQVVISSGLGGIFPKGLPIGKITKIQVESSGLVKFAIVRPFVDFNRLEEVLVIKRVFNDSIPAPSGEGG